MANINFKDKRTIEKLFEMESGYVLDFSNTTFRDFFIDSVGIDIDDTKYYCNGESKAKRLRTFWQIESDYNVGKSIESLADYWLSLVHAGIRDLHHTTENLHKECLEIAKRLKQGSFVEDIEVIREQEEDKDFSKLARTIRGHIDNNEPEVALDRLHTYMIKFIKSLCSNHGIEFKNEETLNAIFGKYVKFLRSNNRIESEMSERILKYSIHVMEAFNDIRNNKSFAHDNPVLNYDESVLIFNNITSAIKFIQTVEEKITQESQVATTTDDDEEYPF